MSDHILSIPNFYARRSIFIPNSGHTVMGDITMKTGKEMLSSILKTTQMGQTGIRCVMSYPVNPELKKALKDQLEEYDAIESQAHAIASRRGWQVPELSSGVRTMSSLMSRASLMAGNTDSRIASMMITGNTKGLIKSEKNAHHMRRGDSAVTELNSKLIQREFDNIQQMRKFL